MIQIKKLSILILLSIFILPILPLTQASMSVSSSTNTYGFNNGYYIGFANPDTFVTLADGGGTQQIPSTDIVYPNYMFFQEQNSPSIYGFYGNCDITINTFFVNNILDFTTDKQGTVYIVIGSLSSNMKVLNAQLFNYDPTNNIAIIQVPSATDVTITFGSTSSSGAGTENIISPTPQPNLTPQPTSPLNPIISPIISNLKTITGNSNFTYIAVIALIIGIIALVLYTTNSSSNKQLKRRMQKQSDWQNPLG